MAYTARLVIIGKTGEDPFAGFVLASGSLPYRRMEVREGSKGENKIYVLPRQGHEIDNIEHPDVDNYAAIIGQSILRTNGKAIVSFNGHMCKRCMANIGDGMKPEIALDSTLFEFRGLPGDARVGGVVYTDRDYEMGFLGVNDVDRLEKRIKGYKLEKNIGLYACVKDTSLDTRVSLPSDVSAEELVRFISNGMISDVEKVLAGGVCILRGNEFETGVYNTPIEQIETWAKK